MGNFITTMLAGGGSMLRPETVRKMESGVVVTGLNPNFDETYGYALFVDEIGGEVVIQHGGDIPPFHSFVLFVPQTGFGLALLTNTDAPSVLSTIARKALELFSPPPQTPAPRLTTAPAQWADYAGSYGDPYGALGAFSIAVEDASLVVRTDDGGKVGDLTQVNGDCWALPPNRVGVFWRDDGGVVQRVVTRTGVATRDAR
jgi:hypothetical protein